MRLTAALLLVVLALALLLLWAGGVGQALAFWAVERQQALQAALAGRLQDLRAGESAAFWSLLGLCAGYGFMHALGPGHGKVLISGAAVGTRTTALRMGLIALAGSLAQAAVAIAFVYGAALLVEATARGTMAAADRWIAPAGTLAVAAIGAWLVWRGLAALRPRAHPAGCGHHHGPDPAAVTRATSPAGTLALIGAIAARPCTGALVVLVVAWRLGVEAAGAAGVLAMGLGTGAFTLLVALLAVAGRDAAFLSAGHGRLGRILAPSLQVLAGGAMLAVAGTLLGAGLAS